MAKRNVIKCQQMNQHEQMQCSVDMDLRHAEAQHQLLERGLQANRQSSDCIRLMSITKWIQA